MEQWKEEFRLAEAVERFIAQMEMPEMDANWLKSLINMAYVFGKHRPK
jgi:Xaa-Pro aminopeptidase